MLINDFIIEGGGYIPQNEKEAHDPRFEMALTCDIKPGEDRRQAAKFGFKLGKKGPPMLQSNGRINEDEEFVLKLSAKKPNCKVQNVINTINDKFPKNPLNPSKRVFYIKGIPVATFEIAERDGKLRIRDILSNSPQQGVGTLLLKRILKIADDNEIQVELTASPYGNNKMSHDKLKNWYKKHGFNDETSYDPSLGYMIREPKTISEALLEYKIDDEKGLGHNPSVHPYIGVTGLIVLMKPSTFLSLVAPIVQHENPQHQKFVNDHVQQDNPIATPTIRFTIPENWANDNYSIPAEVRGHDGRHRMKAIFALEGDVFTPVVLRFTDRTINQIKPEWLRQINSQCITQSDWMKS